MRNWLTAFCALLLLSPGARAQFGNFGDVPVEITSDGNTRFEGGVAIAENNVQIHYGEISIYSDYAEYNPDTRDVLLVGNIRIYTKDNVLTSQRALFNLETKQTRALEIAANHYPALFRALSMRAPSLKEFRVRDAIFTTDDNSNPSFHVKSRSVRIYRDDRVIFVNSAVYAGKVPIFWFPYIFANINNAGFDFLPGYYSNWGAFLLTTYSFPIGSSGDIIGKVHLDLRSKLGVGVGFDAIFQYGKDNRSHGEFTSYYANDKAPSNSTPGDDNKNGSRYRVTFKNTLFLTDDIYATFDINKLSDSKFLEDFFPALYRFDPQPDNNVNFTKWDENYTLGLLTRWQMNSFQEVTERLPEAALDIKQTQVFGSPVFYDGSTTLGYLKRAFATQRDGSLGISNQTLLEDYDSTRFDTFHQFSFPKTYLGWLSIIPRVGIRGTYYGSSGSYLTALEDPALFQDLMNNPKLASQLSNQAAVASALQAGGLSKAAFQANRAALVQRLQNDGPIFRAIINAGIEGSFKISRTYESIQSRALGLDGVRHVMQPYFDYSSVVNTGATPAAFYKPDRNSTNPNSIANGGKVLQFDRLVPSTQLQPIDFPQFTSVDSIDSWNIVRLGVRNRIQTRRDSETFNWFSLDTYFDVNLQNPYTDQQVSNLNNNFTFNPVPWLYLKVDSQLPMISGGFTEVNTSLYYMPFPALQLSVSQVYIAKNPNFQDSSQTTFAGYLRINDQWSVSLSETYAEPQNLFTYQRYMVHRDLSAWVASIGAQVLQNLNQDPQYSLILMMSLKDAPQISLPLAFDQGTSPLSPSGSQ